MLAPARGIVRLLPSSSSKAVTSALCRDGAVIVKSLISRESIGQALAEVSPLFDRSVKNVGTEEDFFRSRTYRVAGLIRHSPTFVSSQLMNQTLKYVYDHFLTSAITVKDAKGTLTPWQVPPQVNACAAFCVDPGADDQILHRDDIVHHNVNPDIKAWDEARDHNREASLSMFVAATRTSRDNGATRLVLGSHLWDAQREPDDQDAVPAEMEVGDALFILSSCYHAGSANTTQDEARIVFQTSLCRGVLRQEENQFLTVPMSIIKQYPYEVQKLAGFCPDLPGLGHVNFEDPVEPMAAHVIPNTA